jgi:transglutaminase-like putative cysteine protease
MIHKLSYTLFFILFSWSSSAANIRLIKPSEAIEAADTVTSAVYPNADIVVVDEYLKTIYQTNGTYTTIDEEYIKILTEKGRRKYQTISKYYTLPYGTAGITNLELIGSNGKVRVIDVAAHSRTMVNPGQMSSNIYNPNSKIMQVSVPGLEIGDTIHIISSNNIVKAIVPDTWSDYNVLEYTAPIKHFIIYIDGPKEMPLVNIRLLDEIAGTVTYTEPSGKTDRNHYIWEVKDVPRMFSEPKMPASHTVVQRLLVSTIPDWESISRWYWKLSKDHINAVTPEMKSKTAELIEGISDRTEKINRIFRFVSQQIRYMGITTETTAPGYEPHDASLTFGNRYGVCRDKAALLAAMLRLADLPAYPVLINAGPRKDEEVPQPYFNHAIVAVGNENGSYTLMDPTDENTSKLLPAYLSFMSFLVAHPDGEHLKTSPVVPASKNMLTIKTSGTLSDEGLLKLTSRIDFNGINDNAYRGMLTRMKQEERRRFFEGNLKRSIAGAKLTALTIIPDDMQDTTAKLSLTMEYEARNYPVVGSNHTLLTAPWLGTGLGYANFLLGNTGLDQRKYPYYIRLTAGVAESISIKLGKTAAANNTPTDSVNLTTGGVSYNQNTVISNSMLSASAEFMINTVQFSPSEYLELKQLLKDREYEQRKKIILIHPDKSDSENDIRILADKTEINISDISNWKSTRTIQKKVLTYAGKKANAELKIGFNPAWESIHLLSAQVVNTNGSIHNVVDNEKNIMDAGWVGSAPRYPPQRMLVVSLPGVEEGSLITYTIERKVFNKPFFSWMKTFQSNDPVDSAEVVITAPQNIQLHISDDSCPYRNTTTNSSDKTVTYSWKIPKQKAIKPEDNLPPNWSFMPAVFVSAGDWQHYSAEIRNHLEEAVKNQEKCIHKSLEIIAGAKTEHDKIMAIRNFVAATIRSAGPSLNNLPLDAISSADTVLTDGYGNTTDKAVILSALLNAVGIKTEFVLVSSLSPQIDNLTAPLISVPQRTLFNRLLVKLTDQDQTVYLNETDQYSAPGCTPFNGKTILDMTGTVSTISLPQNKKEKSMIEFTLSLNQNGDAQLTAKRSYYGMDFASKNKMYSELPPEELRRHFMELTASISQAAEAVCTLKTDFTTYPATREFTVKIPRFAVRSGKYLYLTLPLGMSSPISLRSDSREQALYFASPIDKTVIYNITLPSGTKNIDLLPPPINWQGPANLGSIQYSQKIDDTNRHITLTQKVDFNPAVIRPESYPTLLQINRRLKHPSTRTILIELENSSSTTLE